jgi:hypothetical protein
MRSLKLCQWLKYHKLWWGLKGRVSLVYNFRFVVLRVVVVVVVDCCAGYVVRVLFLQNVLLVKLLLMVLWRPAYIWNIHALNCSWMLCSVYWRFYVLPVLIFDCCYFLNDRRLFVVSCVFVVCCGIREGARGSVVGRDTGLQAGRSRVQFPMK